MSKKCGSCNDNNAIMVETVPTISASCSPCDPCAPTSSVVYNQSPCNKSMPMPSAGCAPTCEAPPLYVKTASDFTYPDKGFGATVAILNVRLAEGQAITHPKYGTLYVAAVLDETNGYYELENRDVTDPTLIGRPVPCDTIFNIGSPSTIATFGGGGCNHLTIDFTIPAIGGTAPAKVESLAGLTIGDSIIIRSKANPSLAYTYTLSGVQGTDTLILTNDGEGGTPYNALNAGSEGQYGWCVESLSDQSICQQAVDTTCITHLLGCDPQGNIKKINGIAANQALVYDTTCGGYVNKVIPETTICVNLQTCFQITVPETCIVTPVYITTSNDTLLLAEAAASVLSDNASPIVYICDKPFTIDLDQSSVGTIKVIPAYTPTQTDYFDTNCLVCVPEDCCSQCAPQINYPDSDYYPPGRDIASSVAIPSGLFTAVGEYKLSIVKTADLSANIFLVHNNASNAIIAAYNDQGVSITIPAGVNNLSYHRLEYCHNDACPVDAQYDEDVNMQIGLPAGILAQYNHNAQYAVYNCNSIGVNPISTTQTSMVHTMVGPTVVSAVSDGSDPWGIPQPDGVFHNYRQFTAYNRRTLALFRGQCLVVVVIPRLLVNVVTVPDPGTFYYIGINSTAMFKTARI